MAVVTAFFDEFGQGASFASFECVREPPHPRCLATLARSASHGRSVSCSVQRHNATLFAGAMGEGCRSNAIRAARLQEMQRGM
jgi:hypothetical protein